MVIYYCTGWVALLCLSALMGSKTIRPLYVLISYCFNESISSLLLKKTKGGVQVQFVGLGSHNVWYKCYAPSDMHTIQHTVFAYEVQHIGTDAGRDQGYQYTTIQNDHARYV